MSCLSDTTMATWVYALHHALEHEGLKSDQLLAPLGLSLAELTNCQQRIPKAALNQAWKAASVATGNDAICLKALNYLNDPSINALITSVQASPNVRQALKLLLRYYRLISAGACITAEIKGEVQIEMTHQKGCTPPTHEDVDMAFGLITKHASVLTKTEIYPSRIEFARSQPNNEAYFQKYFNCPLEFNALHNRLHYPLEVLDESIPGANPLLSNLVEQYLANESQRFTAQSVEQRLHAAMLKMLPSGTPRLEEVAEQLNMSKRTLQRKLRSENLCFKTMLNELRWELAKTYLHEQRYPVQEISYRLGFSEPSNFIRFFKQHAGITPKDYVQ